MSSDGLFSTRPRIMRALLEAFVPAAEALDDQALTNVLARADRLVSGRPVMVRRQLVLALNVLRVLAFLRYLRGMTRLDAPRRRAFLESLQESRLLKLRLAVWGLRTLLFSGYYGDPERQPGLGYRPHADGWSAWNREAGHEPG